MKVAIALALAFCALPAVADDWKTIDGKTYLNVKVVKVEDDAVTILYKEGGALVALSKLPPPIQKQFSYDPIKAKVAAENRAQLAAQSSKDLELEKAQAIKQKQEQQIKAAQEQQKASSAVSQ